ncbi:MAG: 50S ribosomal protein L18 [Chloroflexi bacterium]|nr:50S ribosomal protein L18 [Chloroflexota bacterium]
MKETPWKARRRRHLRVRLKVAGGAPRPRLSVFRSLNNIYAQVIDDQQGHTLASASTLEVEIKSRVDGTSKTQQATLVGELIGQRSLERGITQVVFDRGGHHYHGRVKALAEAARKAGLVF